jgi:hypothetical protein
MSFLSNRRTFFRNSAVWAAAMRYWPRLGFATAFLRNPQREGQEAGTLERLFRDPPDSAWPRAFWIASDGNLTREGITADLEAMHRVGIRGVVYYEVDLFLPKGPARILSPQWRELMQHAMKEASRLGITMSVNNDGGYCGSGGPWITPELSMQMLVWSELTLEGAKRFRGNLPQPQTLENYYQDIVVLAFPTPQNEQRRMADLSPRLTYGIERQAFDADGLLRGTPGTTTLLPRAGAGEPQYLNIDFPEPFTAQALTIALEPWNSELSGWLEVSEDGRNYQSIRQFPVRWPRNSVNFPPVSARHFRIGLQAPDEEYNWLFRVFSKGFPLREVELHGGPRIEDIPGKAAYIRQEAFSGEPPIPPEAAVRKEQILDISDKLSARGELEWEVPAGKWTVLRIGHTSTGKTNHPAPAESLGLECDKLNKRAIEAHFAGYMARLVQDQAAAGATALKIAHIDSWETGSQNWTPGFREEFQKRHGYDLIPYLLILTGRAVDSQEVSERFLWDLRRTVADLLVQNYAGHLREISHQNGLTLSIEGYGGGPFEDTTYGARADLPICELWTGVPAWWDQLMSYCKSMASAAHVYGRPILGSETFTAEPENGKWQNHPYRLKPIADLAFTLGVNQIMFHRYSLQPWLDRKPGMTMGPFGIHYERTNTWWEQTRPWHEYLARCQSLLQRGVFVADVAYLGSENAPRSAPRRDALEPPLPPGYDYDDLPAEALLEQATVRDGRLVFPSGMSYRLLVLPPGRTMTPVLLSKVKDLVVAGLTVVGPRPVKSPSLARYPQCDSEVEQLATELWGECDSVSITENRCGKGRVIWGKPLASVLAELGARPDFSCHDLAVGEQIRYIHRRTDAEDIYFVANALPEARRFLAVFRQSGRRPEFWWPDTGRIEEVAVYDEREESTLIPLKLDPWGSVFVVFRQTSDTRADRVVSVHRNGVEVSGVGRALVPEIQLQQAPSTMTVRSMSGGKYQIEVDQSGTYELATFSGHGLKAEVPTLPSPVEIAGPWELEFPKGWGAPARVSLDRLISWSDHPDPGVKYFSGKATYRRQFDWPARMLAPGRRLHLDLGRVSVLAEVSLNGRPLGVLWKPPFRADVTEMLRVGKNELLVSVVNLWPNRLIGDDHLPDDCEWVQPSTPRNPTPHTWGGALDHWPQWLLENKPSPTGRHTFTTWKHWTKNDPLLESGLLGPVRISATIVAEVK